MPRSQIYIVASPIGDYMTDFAVAALRVIDKTTHLFLESEDEAAARFREKKVIRPDHVTLSFDDPDACMRAAAAYIEAGTDFAILASSGIPGFVDPGWQIFDYIYENDLIDSVDVHPIGMSSALDAALAMCGMNIQKFHFGGHYPEFYNFDGLGWHAGDFALVFFVRGLAVTSFVHEVVERFNPRRIVLFRDIRKKDRSKITVFRFVLEDPVEGQEPPPPQPPLPSIEDEDNADYVGVLYI